MHTAWFIRHGESLSNAGELTESTDSTLLTSLGEKQAQAILSAFLSSGKRPSRIITSYYVRSYQTAEPTINHFRDVRWGKRQDLREFTYLSIDHCRSTTRVQRRPLAQKFWEVNNPAHSDGEGAESFQGFLTRVYGVIELLRYSPEDLIAVFTHGQLIQAILWVLEAEPAKQADKAAFRQFCDQHPIPTGSIVPIEFRGHEEPCIGAVITDHLCRENVFRHYHGSGEAYSESSDDVLAASVALQ